MAFNSLEFLLVLFLLVVATVLVYCYMNFNNMIYRRDLHSALMFTKNERLNFDNSPVHSENIPNELINEFAKLIPRELGNFSEKSDQSLVMFGGQCGNVHLALINYIKKYHSNLHANLTIGQVSTASQNNFDFNQQKCLSWMAGNKPETLDCHVWITIGDDLIIDATLGTYLNTRVKNNVLKPLAEHRFGGILHGHPSALKYTELMEVTNSEPSDLAKIRYVPIALGVEAFSKLSPK